MTEQEILDVIQKILDDNVLYDGRVTMGLPLSQIRDFDEEGFISLYCKYPVESRAELEKRAKKLIKESSMDRLKKIIESSSVYIASE